MNDFGAAVERHRRLLHGRALNLCKDPVLAEDLVQETMVKAIAAQDQFVPGSNLAAWLQTILRNEFFTLKRRGRITPDGGDSAVYLPAPIDQEASLISKDIISFIVELPLEMRRVLVLAAQGLSYEEMADELGVPEGTVKSRVSRARQKLMEITGLAA